LFFSPFYLPGLSSEDGTQSGFQPAATTDDLVWSAEKNAAMRTVVMRRSLAGADSRYFTFDPTAASIPFINALGQGPSFAYHGNSRSSSDLVLLEVGRPLCLCRGGDGGTINGIQFRDNCAPYPASTVLRDHNPSCSLATYSGGLMCCAHNTFLLDADQEVPPAVDTVYMKFRFYYEDPTPDPTYQNAFFMVRYTEHAHGEYDIVKCPEGTPPEDCVHTITGQFKMEDVVVSCTSRSDVWCAPSKGAFPQSQYVQFLHFSAHCHAPACISMEIINMDTNTTICKVEPVYGNATSEIMNEAGYINGNPPCIWGYKEQGLLPPPVLSLNTNMMLITKANATYTHYGAMGAWQMRAAWYMNATADGV
jgi:hypothetical protein